MSEIEWARQSISGNPENISALRALGAYLTHGDVRNDLRRWVEERRRDPRATEYLQRIIADALQHGRHSEASANAEVYAHLRWGAPFHDAFMEMRAEAPTAWPTPPQVTVSKLRHDIDQFTYLKERGILDAPTLEDLICRYQRLRERLANHESRHAPLDDADKALVGDVFNRLIHVRSTPRIHHALSDSWSREAVEKAYVKSLGGVVVIDDALDPSALAALHAFCLESTFWFANRYAHGRIGAFFHDGFSCPLLAQVADELRAELPSIFAPEYPLSQVWAFKNTEYLPPDATLHADFSAVTANLWITPDDANLKPGQGGLTIYDVEAPLHWDFHTYNGRGDVIRPFLVAHNAQTLHIPHRRNRMIIFNADLFHGTQEVLFKEGHVNQRINVSWLYGQREYDHLHRARATARELYPVRGWRSAALRRR